MAESKALSDLVLDEVETQLGPLEEGVPPLLGPEPGTEKLTDEQELANWNAIDVDPKTQMPLNIEDVEMEYVQKALKGEIPFEHVRSLISRKMHPLRYEMVRRAGANDTEKVRYAEKMQAKSRARMQPAQAAPEMPSEPSGGPSEPSGGGAY